MSKEEEIDLVNIWSDPGSSNELDYMPLAKRRKGEDGVVTVVDSEQEDSSGSDCRVGVRAEQSDESSDEDTVSGEEDSSDEETSQQIETCFEGINEARAVLQVLIDQVSKQQSSFDRLTSQITSLENTSKKHEMILSHLTCKLYDKKRKHRAVMPEELKCLHGKCKKLEKSRRLNRNTSKSAKLKVSKSAVDTPQELKSTAHKVTSSKSLPKPTKEASKSLPAKDSSSKKSAKTPTSVKASSSKKSTKTQAKKSSKATKAEDVPTPAEDSPSKDVPTAKHPTKAPIATPVRDVSNPISTSEIDHNSLESIDHVLRSNQSYIDSGKYVCIARRLARYAVFGEAVLQRCTPMGHAGLPALPSDLMYSIKQTILNTFPIFWNRPEEFAKAWQKCASSIESLCSFIRYKRPKKKCTTEVELKTEQDNEAHGPSVSDITTVRDPRKSEIDRSGLLSVSEFVALHSPQDNKLDLATLTQRLAVEVFFGENVLGQSTPCGRGIYPGLPLAEFNLLKQTVLDCNPHLWHDMAEFEKLWASECRPAITKVCRRLRRI